MSSLYVISFFTQVSLVLRLCLLRKGIIMLSRSGSTGSIRPLSGQASLSTPPSSNLPPAGAFFQSRFITAPGTDYDQQFRLPTEFKTRPGYNTTGREVSVKLNSFAVDQFPQIAVHQYDVQIGGGAEKRAVINKVWASQARKTATGEWFIFDGNKLGWSGQNLDRDIHVLVDLDAEEGRPAGRTSNTFRIVIRKAKTLDLSMIKAYLNRQIQMGPEILEGISKFSCYYS
jgi:eukaryotic translation initiation factor 2C